MTDDPTPTTVRRQLGTRLRQLRQDRGETAEDVAKVLQVSVSKVSRMETGARAVSERDIAALIEHFEVRADVAVELTELARSGRRRRDSSPYMPAPEVDHLKFVRSGFVELEWDARWVREFNSGIVPGLLQSIGYMRALMAASVPEDSDTLVAAMDLRLRRQRRLERFPGQYSVIIDEAVLARIVGGSKTMKQQSEVLLRRIDEGAVDLRVIGFDAGVHPGLNSVFVALTMEDATGVPDTIFIEGLVGHQTIDRVEDVKRFENVWNQLEEMAAPRLESRQIVERYRDFYDRPRSQPDERVAD